MKLWERFAASFMSVVTALLISCAASINQGTIVEKTWEEEYIYTTQGHCFYSTEGGLCLFRGPPNRHYVPPHYFVRIQACDTGCEVAQIEVTRYVWDRVLVGDWYPPAELREPY